MEVARAMPLKLYRWNNAAVPGAYTGRLQYVDPDEWEPYLDRHLTEVDEGVVPEKQLIRLWVEAGRTPESFDHRHGSPDDEYLSELAAPTIYGEPTPGLMSNTISIPDDPPGEYVGGQF